MVVPLEVQLHLVLGLLLGGIVHAEVLQVAAVAPGARVEDRDAPVPLVLLARAGQSDANAHRAETIAAGRGACKPFLGGAVTLRGTCHPRTRRGKQMDYPILRTSLLLLAAILIPACDGGGGSKKAPTSMKATDPGIESFPSEGQEHVPVGTPIVYRTDPPTSGPHYPDPWPGGFYSKPVDAPYLVHSMEHGAVIIYYNDQVDKPQKDHLR